MTRALALQEETVLPENIVPPCLRLQATDVNKHDFLSVIIITAGCPRYHARTPGLGKMGAFNTEAPASATP